MKKTRATLIFCLIFLGGCWDSSLSPVIKNMSGQDVALHLMFNDREDGYFIKNNDSLLLPNLLDREGLESIKISSHGEMPVVIYRNDFVKFLREEKDVFVVLKGLILEARSHPDQDVQLKVQRQ